MPHDLRPHGATLFAHRVLRVRFWRGQQRKGRYKLGVATFAHRREIGNLVTLTPAPTDQFTFGLWTVGYNGTDPFGGPTRAPLDVVHVV